MIKIGMIGLSDGNGHPYSFSAIFNGYDDRRMAKSPYPVIYEYLKKRTPDDFGIADAAVTHVWTPDRRDAERIARAARISDIVTDLAQLPDLVDAVIIARDDPDSHWSLAEPFLRRGIPVFLDKPLADNVDDLKRFEPYLLNGQLMSCSAMRYAKELDEARSSIGDLGDIRTLHAVCLNSWFKYGVHIVEALYGLLGWRVRSVCHVGTSTTNIVRVRFADERLGVLQVVEDITPIFQIQAFGTRGELTITIRDLFTMFRRMLVLFVQMIQTGSPVIPPDETIEICRLLIGADASLSQGGREVDLVDIA